MKAQEVQTASPQKVLDLRIGHAHMTMKVTRWPRGAFRVSKPSVIKVSPALRYLIGREVRIVGLLSNAIASGDTETRSACIEEA